MDSFKEFYTDDNQEKIEEGLKDWFNMDTIINFSKKFSFTFLIAAWAFGLGRASVPENNSILKSFLQTTLGIFKDQPKEVQDTYKKAAEKVMASGEVDIKSPESIKNAVQRTHEEVEKMFNDKETSPDVEEVIPTSNETFDISDVDITDTSMPSFDLLYNTIKDHEGEGLPGKPDWAYDDKVKQDDGSVNVYKTVGIGFNMDAYGAKKLWRKAGGTNKDFALVYSGKKKIGQDVKRKLFEFQVNDAIKKAKSYIRNFNSQPKAVKLVLIDMIFNMGSLDKFTNTKKAMNLNDYSWAADEMQYSKPKVDKSVAGQTGWYKQTKDRRAGKMVRWIRELAKQQKSTPLKECKKFNEFFLH